jgi:lipopolysaccharide biosynthesis glycosyltransferase
MNNVLSAKQVQEMIGVEDLDIIAHGYTLERNTLDIWFENGTIVRHESNHRKNMVNEVGEDFFNIDFFFSDVKRWYAEKFNPKLLTLIRTFSQYEPPLLRPSPSLKN